MTDKKEIMPLTQKVIDALRCVHDPEIPNISAFLFNIIIHKY